jgi:hypothetical protein
VKKELVKIKVILFLAKKEFGSMSLICYILPNHQKDKFYVVNLAKEALELFLEEEYESEEDDNPMKSIDYQEQFLATLKIKYNALFTIGGYLEDRSALWSGFEPNSSKMIHLGVDINNLAVGDAVVAPCNVTVVHVFKDTSLMNGWGGRLIFKMDTAYLGADYLLYGHLNPHDLPTVGTTFLKGEVVGSIGDSTANGGWFVHLHVQLIKQQMFDKYADDLCCLDGYLLDNDEMLPEDISADPMSLICYDPFANF